MTMVRAKRLSLAMFSVLSSFLFVLSVRVLFCVHEAASRLRCLEIR